MTNIVCWCFHFVFLLIFYHILPHYHSTTCNFTFCHSGIVESYINVANIVGKIQFFSVSLVFYCRCWFSFFFYVSVTFIQNCAAIISYHLLFPVFLWFFSYCILFCHYFHWFLFHFFTQKCACRCASPSSVWSFFVSVPLSKGPMASIPAEQGATNCYCTLASLLVLFWCVFSGRTHIFTCYGTMWCNTWPFHVNSQIRCCDCCFSCNSQFCLEQYVFLDCCVVLNLFLRCLWRGGWLFSTLRRSEWCVFWCCSCSFV